jgi:glycosyltransferase involved in cell wall biosynthesis
VKIALVVPGGVDRSGEYRVIPALISLISRLAVRNEVHVFALRQETQPARWHLEGARIHNMGAHLTIPRTILAIVREHRASRFDLVQAIWSGAPGFIAATAAGLMRIPCLIHVAGGEIAILDAIGYGGRRTLSGRLREALVLRSATAVTAASGPMVQTLARLGIRARRIPLGADLKIWQLSAPKRRDVAEPARLIHIASLNRVKDQSTLLLALAELSGSGLNFHLDIVGEDTLRGEVQALAARLRLADKVRFHGFVSQRKLPQLVREAHLLLVASRHEAGPLVVLEAAALGVPTVGTAVGHVSEFAPHAAVAVPVADPSAMAAAIARLLADEDSRLRIAVAASQLAALEDADHTARAFQALYCEILSQ